MAVKMVTVTAKVYKDRGDLLKQQQMAVKMVTVTAKVYKDRGDC